MEDSSIIDLFWQRSSAAIEAAAEKYGAYCRSVANNILHNEQDAEECVNDAYMRAWEQIPPSRPERLAPYLGRITRNLALDRYRRQNAEKRGAGQTELILSELSEVLSSGPGVEKAVEDQEIVRVLNGFLHSCNEKERGIFVSRYWTMSSVQDIASAYGMSVSAVSSLLYRMRAKLKKTFAREDIEI